MEAEKLERIWQSGRGRDPAKHIGSILPQVVREAGLDLAGKTGELNRAWGQVVGPMLAERSNVERLTRGTLAVRADSQAVKFELDQAARGGLLQAFAEAAGKPVRKIRITVRSAEKNLKRKKENNGSTERRKTGRNRR
jgi:hypothetical protein